MTEPQFRRLLRLMTRNLVRDRTHRLPPVPVDFQGDSTSAAPAPAALDSTPSAHVAREELEEVLLAKIRQWLSPEDWTLFWRHFVDKISYTQLAREQHLQPDALRMHLNRIKARLQSELEDFGRLWER
jgi:DNA-directed RNA polymerase specialized sigma24 family protein